MAQEVEKPVSNESGADLRGKLAARLAVAGGMVAVLLGILAFFDYLASAPPDENEAPVFKQPVPVPPKKEVSKPVLPAENPPEPPPPEKVEPAKAELPPPPVVESKPEVLPEKPAKAPSTAAVPKPVPQSVPAPAKPVPEASSAPVSPPVTKVPAMPEVREPSSRLSVRVTETKPAASSTSAPPPAAAVQPLHPVAPPNLPKLFSGFLLQAGVFSSPQRAEELHAKLTLSGVPSTLETRVQVGPFRTRQEAEAAQAKLKTLGIEAILVPPKGGR